MKLSHAEELLVQRFLDGELTADRAAAFRARLEAEPVLRQRVEQQRAIAAGFAAERTRSAVARGSVAPADFTAGVLSAVRRLPSRKVLDDADAHADALRLCRRLLLAAAVLFAVGLTLASGVLDRGGSDTLQAAPNEVQREMERLDALIQAGSLEGGAAGRRERAAKWTARGYGFSAQPWEALPRA